jgi:hypothetical protein
LLDYYAFHLDGFKRPKSLEVLGEVFSWGAKVLSYWVAEVF